MRCTCTHPHPPCSRPSPQDAPGCHEFLLQDDGKWLHVKETETIGEAFVQGGQMCYTGCTARVCMHLSVACIGCSPIGTQRRRLAGLHWTLCSTTHRLCMHFAFAGEGKMFSPGNLRATFDNPAYEKLIAYYIGEKYTLRYTGGMVRTMAGFARLSCGPQCACTRSADRAAPVAFRQPGRVGTPPHVDQQCKSTHFWPLSSTPAGARRVPDHREGEGRVHQRHLPLHQGQAAPAVRGAAQFRPGFDSQCRAWLPQEPALKGTRPGPISPPWLSTMRVRGISPLPALPWRINCLQVAPLALLVEKAGGASSCDGLCVSGLDVEVKQHDQRTQVNLVFGTLRL